MIRTEIAKLAKPIDNYIPHPRNVREGDVGAITLSLEAHGQYRPIIIQKTTNHIIAGNHTWKAAKSLGWTEIAVQVLDIDDDRALRILLADNRATDLASYDEHALAEVLSEFARSFDMSGLLWDQDDLDDLLRREQFQLSQQAFPTLSQQPRDGGINPLDTDVANSITDNTRTAAFFLQPEEFEELRQVLALTQMENKNDALLKVAREWRSNQNL